LRRKPKKFTRGNLTAEEVSPLQQRAPLHRPHLTGTESKVISGSREQTDKRNHHSDLLHLKGAPYKFPAASIRSTLELKIFLISKGSVSTSPFLLVTLVLIIGFPRSSTSVSVTWCLGTLIPTVFLLLHKCFWYFLCRGKNKCIRTREKMFHISIGIIAYFCIF
jgi:hypothetical protein